MNKTDPIIKDTAYQNQARDITAWLSLADNDYLAARTLIRRGLLVQGAILSNSAIEKYLKTVHRIKNIKFDKRGEKAHNLVNLYNQLKETDSRKDLSESFSKFSVRIFAKKSSDFVQRSEHNENYPNIRVIFL
ncbi:MAG: hypothetical protein PHS62_01775 [Patescibacteria group bacterium]|nr:hypothetical protein [Patescibacteria group bacterium]